MRSIASGIVCGAGRPSANREYRIAFQQLHHKKILTSSPATLSGPVYRSRWSGFWWGCEFKLGETKVPIPQLKQQYSDSHQLLESPVSRGRCCHHHHHQKQRDGPLVVTALPMQLLFLLHRVSVHTAYCGITLVGWVRDRCPYSHP